MGRMIFISQTPQYNYALHCEVMQQNFPNICNTPNTCCIPNTCSIPNICGIPNTCRDMNHVVQKAHVLNVIDERRNDEGINTLKLSLVEIINAVT